MVQTHADGTPLLCEMLAERVPLPLCSAGDLCTFGQSRDRMLRLLALDMQGKPPIKNCVVFREEEKGERLLDG